MIPRLLMMAAAAGEFTPAEVAALVNTQSYGVYKEIMQDEPFCYYRLGEADGVIAYDETYNNDGIYSGATTLGEASKFITDYDADTAASRTTSNGQVAHKTSGSFQYQGPLTIEAFMKVASGTGDTWVAGVWEGALLYMVGSNRYPTFIIKHSGGNKIVTGPDAMTADVWYHVAGVYVPGKSMVLYVNGVRVASTISSVPSTIVYSSSTFYMGYCGATAQKRTVDEAAFFTKALDSGRIMAHYRGSIQRPAPRAKQSGALAAWDFSEDTGTTAYDRMANIYDGTYENGPTIFQDSLTSNKGDRSVSFNRGSSEDMQPTTTLPHLDKFTLEAWVELTAPDTGNNLYTIIGRYNASNVEYFLCFDWNTNNLRCYGIYSEDGSSTDGIVIRYSGIEINTPYHVVMTFDGTDLVLYMNGEEVDKSNAPGTVYDGNAPTLVGAMGPATGSYNFWHGRIDDPAVYDYALSHEQVLEHFTFSQSYFGAAALEDSPSAYWKFNEISGATAADEIGSNDATCAGTYYRNYPPITGEVGRSVYLDGTSGYAHTTWAGPQGSASRSYEFWSYNIGTTTVFRALLGHGNAATGEKVIILQDEGTDGEEGDLRISCHGCYKIFARNISSGIRHIVVTFNGSTMDDFRAWVDGEEVTEIRASSSLTTTIDTGSTNKVNIGRDPIGAGYYFHGYIDEVIVYDSALTDARIKEHFDRGTINRDYRSRVLGASPAAYYRLSEWAGETYALDETRLGADGTYVNSPSASGGLMWGDPNKSINFNGSTQRITIPALYTGATTGLTVTCWIKPTTLGGSARKVFYHGDNAECTLDINTSNQLEARVRMSSGSWETSGASATLTVGTTYFAVLMWSKGNYVQLYINGLLAAEDSSIADLFMYDPGASYGHRIGCNGSNAEFFAGDIDEVACFQYPTGPTYIKQLYNFAPHTAGRYAWEVIKDTPIAYWRLGEASGTIANDSVGGYNGTYTNTPTLDVTGAIDHTDTAVTFASASNEYVAMGDVLDFEYDDPFSVSCWFNTTATATYYVIVAKQGSVSPFAGYSIYQDDNQYIGFTHVNTRFTNDIEVRTNTTYNDGKWHHLVTTYDGSSAASGVIIYVDGDAVATTTVGDTLTGSTVNASPFQIASRNGADYPWNGSLDEVAVYPYELDKNQVRKHYFAGVQGEDAYRGYEQTALELGPVSYWLLDDKTGTTVTDQIGTGDGTITNDPYMGMQGPIGRLNKTAMEFDGSTQDISMGDIHDFERTDEFSISCWFKSRSVGSSRGTLISKLDHASPNSGYELAIRGDDSGKIRFLLINNGASNVLGMNSLTTNLDDSVWHHIIVTYDGSSTPAGTKIYIDGIDDTNTTAINDTLDSSILNNIPLHIGSRNSDSGYLPGLISDVVIYDAELTPLKVCKLYAASRVIIEDQYTHATALLSYRPISFWRMDEGTGTNAIDCVGGLDGTYTNTPTLTQATPFIYGHGHAVGLASTTDEYITMGDIHDFERTDEFSFSIWCRTSTTGSYGMLLTKANNDSPYEGIHLYQESSADQIVCYIQSTTQGIGARITATHNDGEWHHLVLTYDGSSASSGITWYVDGEVEASSTIGGAISTTILNAHPFQIGNRESFTSNTWNGDVDETAVFDRELTAAEVANIYTGTPKPDYVQVVLTLEPVGYWRLGEATGTVARDVTKNTDGTYTNTPTLEVAGALALDLDTAVTFVAASSEYVTMGDVLDFDYNEAFSLSCWFKTSTSSTQMSLVSKNTHLSPWNGYELYQHGTSNKLYFVLVNSAPANYIEVHTDNTYNDGEWHHTIMAYDGSTNASGVTIYVDGVVVATTVGADTLGATTVTAFPFNIASRNNGQYSFNGSLDEVAVFDKELTSVNVADLYTAGI